MATVWRLLTHHAEPEKVATWSRKEGRIAIGWSMTGDLTQYQNSTQMGQAILDSWPDSHNWQFGKTQLYDFANTMKQGDLVIVSTGKYRAFVAQIKGDYEFRNIDIPGVAVGAEYYHQRTVDILPVDADRVWRLSGGKAAQGHNIRWTLIRCANEVDLEDL